MISALSLSSPNSFPGLGTPTPSSRRLLPRATAATATARATVASAPPPTLYGVLGLQAGATGREIKAAYRRLARECHPDAKGGPSAVEFIRLHDAYATLSDPDKRARYDRDIMTAAAVSAAEIARPRWPQYSSYAGRPASSGFSRPTRRTWETDQCW